MALLCWLQTKKYADVIIPRGVENRGVCACMRACALGHTYMRTCGSVHVVAMNMCVPAPTELGKCIWEVSHRPSLLFLEQCTFTLFI